MSAERFGILSIFDHNVHSWKTYKGRLLQWFIANEINASTDATGIRRRAILLSALAEGSYQLASDLALPKALEDVPFQDILIILDAHFTPKRLGIGERHKFYAATQQPSESHTEWAARLRGLTAHCNFSNVEEALRDRFVIGMRPGLEKEKLYAKDITELTLAKAVELAEGIRCARAGAAASNPAMAATSADSAAGDAERAMFKIREVPFGNNSDQNKSAGKLKCAVCGFFHGSKICKYRNYVCKKCNKTGHLQRVCKQIRYLTTADVAEDDDDD
ncbi:jg7384, partial [Pararge aegeria aegeria]